MESLFENKNLNKITIIDANRLHGYLGSSCGYCKSSSGSYTLGFQAKQVTAEDYEKMLDRGFRRCGDYYYKPNLFKSCCKLFTIKIDVLEHKLRKSHKKAWNKWKRYLNGEFEIEDKMKEETLKNDPNNIKKGENDNKDNNNTNVDVNHGDNYQNELEKELNRLEILTRKKILEIVSKLFADLNNENGQDIEKEQLMNSNLDGNLVRRDKNNPHCYFTNIIQRLVGINKKSLSFKIKDFVKKKGEILKDELYKIENKYILDFDKKGNLRFKSKDYINPKAKEGVKKIETKFKKKNLNIKIVKAESSPEKFDLYKRYCESIHEKDNQSESGFKSFLCKKNLVFGTKKSQKDQKELKQGCYHMEYYLDDKLIAVGVVDFLPHGFSTVYFYYEPILRKLKFGIVSSLLEIDYIKELNKSFPEFKYYYMGFYIHNCDKMNYKGDFNPGLLLCPKSLSYQILTPELKSKIENGLVEISEGTQEKDPQMFASKNQLKEFLPLKLSVQVGDKIAPIGLYGDRIVEIFLKELEDIFMGLGKELSGEVVFKLK